MKKHKNLGAILIVSGVLILVFSVFFFGILPNLMKPSTNLWLGNGIFHADFVTDEAGRTNGLSGVSELAPNKALLMAFPNESKWGIWMKDMKIPIDIVWLDKNKKVVYIVKNASPEDSTSKIFEPKTPAKYIIEVPAGTVDNLAVNIDQTASFQVNEGDIK